MVREIGFKRGFKMSLISLIVGVVIGAMVMLIVLGLCKTADRSNIEIELLELSIKLENAHDDISYLITLLPEYDMFDSDLEIQQKIDRIIKTININVEKNNVLS